MGPTLQCWLLHGWAIACPAGVYGSSKGPLYFAMSIMHVECTLVPLYASYSRAPRIGFN